MQIGDKYQTLNPLHPLVVSRPKTLRQRAHIQTEFTNLNHLDNSTTSKKLPCGELCAPPSDTDSGYDSKRYTVVWLPY